MTNKTQVNTDVLDVLNDTHRTIIKGGLQSICLCDILGHDMPDILRNAIQHYYKVQDSNYILRAETLMGLGFKVNKAYRTRGYTREYDRQHIRNNSNANQDRDMLYRTSPKIHTKIFNVAVRLRLTILDDCIEAVEAGKDKCNYRLKRKG